MLSVMDSGSFKTMSSITHNSENFALGKFFRSTQKICLQYLFFEIHQNPEKLIK